MQSQTYIIEAVNTDQVLTPPVSYLFSDIKHHSDNPNVICCKKELQQLAVSLECPNIKEDLPDTINIQVLPKTITVGSMLFTITKPLNSLLSPEETNHLRDRKTDAYDVLQQLLCCGWQDIDYLFGLMDLLRNTNIDLWDIIEDLNIETGYEWLDNNNGLPINTLIYHIFTQYVDWLAQNYIDPEDQESTHFFIEHCEINPNATSSLLTFNETEHNFMKNYPGMQEEFELIGTVY